MSRQVLNSTLLATVLAIISNIIAQKLSPDTQDPHPSISLPELLRFIALTVLITPPNVYWQHLLEHHFPSPLHPALPRRPPGTEHDPDIELPTLAEPATTSTTSANANANANADADADADIDVNADGATPRRSPRRGPLDWRNTAIKWFVDCITLGALWNSVAFLAIMGVLRGRGWGEIGGAVRRDTFPLIWASYKIWPLASVASFTLVPVHWRVVFLSGVGLVWGVYLSLVAARQ